MSALRASPNEPATIPQIVDLTPARYRVAQLLPSGMTTAEIADQLCLSDQTVKNHAMAVYRRVGLTGPSHSRAGNRAPFVWLLLSGRIRLRQVPRIRNPNYSRRRIDFAALVDLEEDPAFERARLLKAFERFLDSRLGETR